MKTCLNCQKDFEYKREAAKFCSDKCRVMYNRKNPKNAVSLMQVQVLYNEVLNLVSQIKTAPLQAQQEVPKTTAPFSVDEPLSFEKLKQEETKKVSSGPLPTVVIEAIKRKYVEDRRELTCSEEYIEWLERLESDNRLNSRDKALVKSTT